MGLLDLLSQANTLHQTHSQPINQNTATHNCWIWAKRLWETKMKWMRGTTPWNIKYAFRKRSCADSATTNPQIKIWAQKTFLSIVRAKMTIIHIQSGISWFPNHWETQKMNLWGWDSEENIRKSWGKRPTSSASRGRQKTTSWNPQNMNNCCTFIEQNKKIGIFQPRKWRKPQKNIPKEDPSHLVLPKSNSQPWEKWRKKQKCEEECPNYL